MSSVTIQYDTELSKYRFVRLISHKNMQIEQLSAFRRLAKTGFAVHVFVEGLDYKISLEGITQQTKVSEVKKSIHDREVIHPSRQRLFLAGEALNSDSTFGECGIKAECTLVLKCYIPVLVSTLVKPGPMVTEIEVHPRNAETVRNVKYKLNVKFGIDIELQRLYLNVTEMTSYFRRRELDDIALLSRYLSPSCGNELLELRLKNAIFEKGAKIITMRIPVQVPDARETHSSEIEENWDGSDQVTQETQPSFLPHKIGERLVRAWITLEMNTEKIIKRDPLVNDIVKVLKENLASKEILNKLYAEGATTMSMKFVDHRIILGGKNLEGEKHCNEDYQMRDLEQLIDIELEGVEIEIPQTLPIVSKPSPLSPLKSYDDVGTRYTMPMTPSIMGWQIPPSDPADRGANPELRMEISAFSYSRLHGSWDIIEHYKTYVEIMIEGTFTVSDTGLVEAVRSGIEPDQSGGIFYLQDSMEVTVLGPENDAVKGTQMVNRTPMIWYRKSAGEKRGKGREEVNIPTLDREINPLCFHSPFRFNNRPINMPKPTELHNSGVQYNRPGISELYVGNWYLGKERVSDVSLPEYSRGRGTFDATCSRGVTIGGRPFLTTTYGTRSLAPTCGPQRRAFDFRLQAQFYICSKQEDFEENQKVKDSERFTIRVRHNITKFHRVPNYSDVITHHTSPSTAAMETTLVVKLANNNYLKEKQITY